MSDWQEASSGMPRGSNFWPFVVQHFDEWFSVESMLVLCADGVNVDKRVIR